MRSAYRLRSFGTTAPSLLRQYARADAYPGLRAFASLSMARSVSRRDKGYLVATAKAAEDLEPATQATMRYLLAVVGAWREAISDQESGS